MPHRPAPVRTPAQRRLAPLALCLLALCAGLSLATPASAQAPKPGDYYEDDSLYGFKVKTPKG